MTQTAGPRCLRTAAMLVALPLLLVGCLPGGSSSGESSDAGEVADAGVSDGASSEAAGGATATGPVEIEFWTINLQSAFGDYIQGLIDSYEEANPDVTVAWVDVPGDEMSRRLLTTVASGDVPDVVNITSLELFAFTDAVADLDELLPAETLDAYFDGLLSSVSLDDRQLALPWYHGGPHVGYYNRDLIEQAGLDLADPPRTYEDALDWGQTVYDETGVYGSNLFPGTYVFQESGFPILNEDATSAAFNTPEAVAMLERFKQAYDAGSIAPGAISPDDTDFPEKIENEQVAFAASFFSTALTNVESAAPQVFDKLEVVPAVTGDSETYALHGIQTLVVLEGSPAASVAADFAAFVTSPTNQLEFCRLAPIFPSTEATIEDPFFTDIEVEGPLDQARQVIVEQMSNTVDGSLGTTIELELRELFDEEVRAVLLGEKDAETALADAEEAINARLEEEAGGE